MIPEWRRRCMDAVAAKLLPVRPGDYVLFHVSGSRLLVVIAMADSPDVQDGKPTTGQELSGLMTSQGGTCLVQLKLDWSGYETFWTISRPTV